MAASTGYTRHLELEVALLKNFVRQFGPQAVESRLRSWDPDLRIPAARTGIDDYLAEQRLIAASTVRAEAKESQGCSSGDHALPLVEGVFLASADPPSVINALAAVLPVHQQQHASAFPFTPKLLDGAHIFFSSSAINDSALASFAMPDTAVMTIQRVETDTAAGAGSGPTAAAGGSGEAEARPILTPLEEKAKKTLALENARKTHELLLWQLERALEKDDGEVEAATGAPVVVGSALEKQPGSLPQTSSLTADFFASELALSPGSDGGMASPPQRAPSASFKLPPHCHIFLLSEDEAYDKSELIKASKRAEQLASEREKEEAEEEGREEAGFDGPFIRPSKTPGVLRSFYSSAEGRATTSATIYGCALTVMEPVTFHLLAQQCRDASGLDQEGVAAAFLPHASAPGHGEGGPSSSLPSSALWQEAVPSSVLSFNTALIVPRTFFLLSRYPCFGSHFSALRSFARMWQLRLVNSVRTLLGLNLKPPISKGERLLLKKAKKLMESAADFAAATQASEKNGSGEGTKGLGTGAGAMPSGVNATARGEDPVPDPFALIAAEEGSRGGLIAGLKRFTLSSQALLLPPAPPSSSSAHGDGAIPGAVAVAVTPGGGGGLKAAIADVVSQGKYRWELASRLKKVQMEVIELERQLNAHAEATNAAVASAVKRAKEEAAMTVTVITPSGIVTTGRRGSLADYSQAMMSVAQAQAQLQRGAGAGGGGGPSHHPSNSHGHPLPNAHGNGSQTPVPAAPAGSGAMTPVASSSSSAAAQQAAIVAAAVSNLSPAERARFEARSRDLQSQARHLTFILIDVTNRLRESGKRLLAYCSQRAFEGPLNLIAPAIIELLSCAPPAPGQRCIVPSASFAFNRPLDPWAFAQGNLTSSSSPTPQSVSGSNGAADAASEPSMLVTFLRCFVDCLGPYDPGNHNTLGRLLSASASASDGAADATSDPLYLAAASGALSNGPKPWQMGSDLRHPETQEALLSWALPVLCNTLSPSDLVDTVAACLTEHNVVVLQEPIVLPSAPASEGGSSSSSSHSAPVPATSIAVSRCILALSLLLSPLHFEQNCRPKCSLATSQSLAQYGAEALAQANLLGTRTIGCGLTTPFSASNSAADAGRTTPTASAGGAATPSAGNRSRRGSLSDIGGSLRNLASSLGSKNLGGGGGGGGGDSAPATTASAAYRAACSTSSAAALAAAAAADLVLISASTGAVVAFVANAGGDGFSCKPISEVAARGASVCRMPGRDDLIASVQKAYGEAFPESFLPATAPLALRKQYGPGGSKASTARCRSQTIDPVSPAQMKAARAVAAAIGSHIRWSLASLYLAALPPKVAERGLKAPSLRTLQVAIASASASASPSALEDLPTVTGSLARDIDLASAARADLLAHTPSIQQLQGTFYASLPWWKRFASSQILHQHHQSRASRAFSSAFRGGHPSLLTDSTKLISSVIAATVAAASTSASAAPAISSATSSSAAR